MRFRSNIRRRRRADRSLLPVSGTRRLRRADEYLQQRGIAAFTVDAVTNDSYISSPGRLIDRTLAEIERSNGGIVLFHDIKRATAKALPVILKELKARGYSMCIWSPRRRWPRTSNCSPIRQPDRGQEKRRRAAAAALDLRRGRRHGRPGRPGDHAGFPEPRQRRMAPASPHIANSDGTATAVSPWKPHLRLRRKRASNGGLTDAAPQ